LLNRVLNSEEARTVRSARSLTRAIFRLSALVAALALASVPEVSAATIESASVQSTWEHTCACGMQCRDYCCCDHTAKRKSDRVARSESQPAKPKPKSSGPCIQTAPCGLPGSPTSSPLVRCWQANTVAQLSFTPPPAGDLLTLAPAACIHSVLASRLIDPPESFGIASSKDG
jgi:hypothetical protein